MAWWKNILKRSSKQDYNPYYGYAHGYGFGTSTTNVNTSSVAGIAAWWRGTQVLSNVIAGLPKHLVKYTDNDRVFDKDSPSVKLLTDMANRNLSSYDWHDYMMQSVLNYGNGYSTISRDQHATPTALTTVNPEKVTVHVYNNDVVYKIDGIDDPIAYEDMYHIKGLSHNAYVGINPLQAHKIGLGATLSAQNYGKNSFDKGFLHDGYVKIDGQLTPEVKKNLRESWSNRNLGTENMGTPVLDIGQEYVPLKMSNQDAQYIETRRFQKSEIATILGIPSHLINEMGDAKYNNVENTNTQFVQYTIMSYVHKFEHENKKLLRTTQRKTHDWKYNVNGLLRGDMSARSEYYAKAIQNSWMKPSEARNFEDMDGGIDDYLISTNNNVPFSKLDQVLDTNKGGINEQT